MIVSATGPLDPGLRALYVSLNSPVVTLAALPVGPASALVAVHERAAGATLAVRSARTGTVAFYTAGDAAGSAGADVSEAEVAAQTVLSFAESLGFLFEDALAPADAAPELLARWEAWVGEAAVGGPLPEADDALTGAAPALRLSKFRLPLPGVGPDRATAHRVEHVLRGAAPAEADPSVHGERTRRL